jgi:hypothetical protein
MFVVADIFVTGVLAEIVRFVLALVEQLCQALSPRPQ